MSWWIVVYTVSFSMVAIYCFYCIYIVGNGSFKRFVREAGYEYEEGKAKAGIKFLSVVSVIPVLNTLMVVHLLVALMMDIKNE